jgi:hypothetical protein
MYRYIFLPATYMTMLRVRKYVTEQRFAPQVTKGFGLIINFGLTNQFSDMNLV